MIPVLTAGQVEHEVEPCDELEPAGHSIQPSSTPHLVPAGQKQSPGRSPPSSWALTRLGAKTRMARAVDSRLVERIAP
jgi:hypothetical protein